MKITHALLGLTGLLATIAPAHAQDGRNAPHSPTSRSVTSKLSAKTPAAPTLNTAPPILDPRVAALALGAPNVLPVAAAVPWGAPTNAVQTAGARPIAPQYGAPQYPAPQYAPTPYSYRAPAYQAAPYTPWPALRTAQLTLPGAPMPVGEVMPAPAPQPVYAQPSPPTVTFPSAPSGGAMFPPGAGFAPGAGLPGPNTFASPGQSYPGSPSFSGSAAPNNCDPNAFDPSSAGDPGDPGDPFDPGVYDPGDPGPRWFASLSGVLMTRTQTNGHMLAFENSNPNSMVLNSRDTINGQWRGGFEARLGRRIGFTSAIEATYWMLDPFYATHNYANGQFNINSTLDFVTNGPVLIDGKPATNFFLTSAEQRLQRRDEVWSGEINWLEQPFMDETGSRLGFMGIAGVRWFHFREGTAYQAVTNNTSFGQYDDYGNVGNYDIMTRNDLIGGQIGTRVHYNLCPAVRLYATPKIGIYGNSISMRQRLHCGCPDGGTDGFDFTSHKTEASLLSQLDFGATWQVTYRLSAYISYRVMGVNNVALADDQYNQYMSSTSAHQTIQSNGSLIMHGGLFSAQYSF